jgi:hypothetical protein
MMHPKAGEIDTRPKNCGHCSTKTVFRVLAIDETVDKDEEANWTEVRTLRLLKCQTCSKVTLEEIVEFSEDWYPEYKPPVYVLYPTETDPPPPPAKDMPENIANTYNEARAVLPHSPKASAALLRLAIQQLCQHLGKPGENLNHDIGALVRDGLSPSVQQALDSVRVIGNNAVHPGSIDFDDNPKLVETLFKLVNFIVEEMITRPREIKEIYDSLPQDKLDGIETRDRKNKKPDRDAAIKSLDATTLGGN